MASRRHFLCRAGAALARAGFLLFAVALGALAGILILFRTGLYAGHYDHQQARAAATLHAVYLNQAAFAAILRNAALKSLPEPYRFTEASDFVSSRWRLDESGLVHLDDKGRVEQDISWDFKLRPTPTAEDWPQLAETLKTAFSNAAESGGFVLEDVRLRDDGLIEVSAWALVPFDHLVPPKPAPDGVLRDLSIWLGSQAPPRERSYPELWKR